jgi:hypothetical protein
MCGTCGGTGKVLSTETRVDTDGNVIEVTVVVSCPSCGGAGH